MKFWQIYKDATKQQKIRWIKKWGLITSGSLVLSFIGLLLLAKLMGPPALLVPQTTILYAADGSKMGEMNNGGQNRYWLPLKKIDKNLINATISIEDKSFYDHHGFDFKRIAGAILADIKAGSKVQGASTITQQYARNLFLTHDKTWRRKFQEAFYTLRLEMNYSKDEILEGYLNTIYYGHGSYGIQSASRYYFGKNADDLTLAESSMLAGIPKGPGRYSPILNEENAKRRQKIILTSMAEDGSIKKGKIKEVVSERLTYVREKEEKVATVAPYFQDAVMRTLKKDLNINTNSINFGGLRIYTTLDPHMQEVAEHTIENRIIDNSNIETALVAMDPRNGDVKALVGGRDFEKSPFNRAIQAKRAPGSTFKPFLYYTALEHGYTASTPIKSEPTTFAMADGVTKYKPKNFKNRYANDFITMAQALALSDNIYAVKTNLYLGPDKLVKTAKKFGIKSELEGIPSLALGSNAVGVLELTKAYGVFANGGKRTDPVFITKITDSKGEVLYEHKYEGKQVIDENKAFVMTDLLAGTFDEKLNDYTSVTGSSINHYLTRPMAGKSGSTPNDSWMVGYAPQLVTGVWVGYDNNEELHDVNDTGYSKRIWAQFMEGALKNKQILSFKQPEGVTAVTINPQNGKLATESCPVTRISYYEKGTEPTEFCDEHGVSKEIKDKLEKKEKKKGFFKRIFSW
ncbi:transglycosylase domain-containing protein [Fictibacillus phosphorivorans]|uniref:transglycosylase domain-containing protein n=1 Tax=Fictibacillus phosphorivorans TaxID=1221500 RepID=UPI0020410DC2|nr:PBP1A family penicillin-binding protein [Fictibacillus phosphorivorans]MCM3718452.1 PBP1A family penicillin-binding protein [Fictibacillus phosphorivorans]MCM3776076.1 PBP1A family penicillin-binding protein [Fictibacillus phosphorivorans]